VIVQSDIAESDVVHVALQHVDVHAVAMYLRQLVHVVGDPRAELAV
jgi:hypothetical protein